jgi:hypothetical protein
MIFLHASLYVLSTNLKYVHETTWARQALLEVWVLFAYGVCTCTAEHVGTTTAVQGNTSFMTSIGIQPSQLVLGQMLLIRWTVA